MVAEVEGPEWVNKVGKEPTKSTEECKSRRKSMKLVAGAGLKNGLSHP